METLDVVVPFLGSVTPKPYSPVDVGSHGNHGRAL
jgi:hypothetical protein